jgi:alkanesulfonate monooxygenase SsuD/methylene tetrahydromethanopterin reductase-like flavin-dependent oxidoreductase (luciferase family)
VRFGLDVAQHQLSWDELLSRVRLAERLGFDGAWVFDHFKALYGDPAGPCLEGWTLLAGLAASTERIRLGALVTGVTYRLELGLGAAWHAQEHRELGLEFPGARERIDRLEEAVQVIRFLMTMDNVTYLGRRYRLNGASYRPRPVQKPHPPIWIGGGGERFTLPVVARNADFWHGYGSVPELVRKSRLLDELAEKAERDPAAIERSSSLSISEARPAVEDRIESLAAAGFSYLTVSWPSEGQERMEEFARDVMPIFAQK